MRLQTFTDARLSRSRRQAPVLGYCGHNGDPALYDDPPLFAYNLILPPGPPIESGIIIELLVSRFIPILTISTNASFTLTPSLAEVSYRSTC